MVEFKPTSFGDYILQDRIGAGGMAEIFLATSQGIEGFEKRLVIKRILPTLSDDEQFVRMFVEEAKLCVSLHHPNIVQVYDLGLIDGQYFIAMEYVDGRDLLKTLAACGRQNRGFPTDIALYIVMEILKGLEYVHRLTKDGQPLGIIHRDVSPSNVMMSFEGEVKLGDFGIAKARTRERTASGILKGKFGYMAPEQVAGVPIDFRADIFAAGILLYELLTGHRLFAGKNDIAVLERVREADISPSPRHYRDDLDDELEHIVLKALEREPENRFASCIELHDAIHNYVYGAQATVGPSQLAVLMRKLFLDNNAGEQARRRRLRLPLIRGSRPRLTPAPRSLIEDTHDDRAAPNGALDETRDDFVARSRSEITDGREVVDAPLLDNQRPSTPSPFEAIEKIAAFRRTRPLPTATKRDRQAPTRSRGPGQPRRRSAIGALAESPREGFDPSEIVERADADVAGTDFETTLQFAAVEPEPDVEAYESATEGLDGVATPEDVAAQRGEPTAIDPPPFAVIDEPSTEPRPTDAEDGFDGLPTPYDPHVATDETLTGFDLVAPADGVLDDEDTPEEQTTDLDADGEATVARPAGVSLREAAAEAPTEVGNGIADEATLQGAFDDGLASEIVISAPSTRQQTSVLALDDGATDPSPPPSLDPRPAPSPSAVADDSRLHHPGASGLFGALAALDDPHDFAYDDPPDGPTVDGGPFYAEFSESMGKGEPFTPLDDEPPPDHSEVSQQRDAYGETRMGVLADPILANDRLPSFPLHGEEPTNAVKAVDPGADDLLEPDAHSLINAAPSDLALGPDFDDDPGSRSRSPITALRSSQESTVPKPTVKRRSDGGRFHDEEPTDEHVSDREASDTPLLAAMGSGLRWPSAERSPADGLISPSFELHLETSALSSSPASARRTDRARTANEVETSLEDEAPVHPVSMVRAPGGVEETASRLADEASAVPQPPRGAQALRAVVGRKGRIRERNRVPRTGAPNRSSPHGPKGAARPAPRPVPDGDRTPPMPSPATPGPKRARASEGRAKAEHRSWGESISRASASWASWFSGHPGAPAAMGTHRPRSPWLTAAVYGLPILAVMLTVAALVTSLVLADRGPRGSAKANDAEVSRIVRDDESGGSPIDDREAPANESNAAPSGPAPNPTTNALPARSARALIRMRCGAATTVRIAGVGSFEANPALTHPLKPGKYRIRLFREGRVVKRIDVRLAEGQRIDVPCP